MWLWLSLTPSAWTVADLGTLGTQGFFNFLVENQEETMGTLRFCRKMSRKQSNTCFLVCCRQSFKQLHETNLKLILTPKPGGPQFNITHGTIRVAHAGGISGIMGPGTGRDFTSSLAINGSKTSGIRRSSSPHGCQNGAIRLTWNLHKN